MPISVNRLSPSGGGIMHSKGLGMVEVGAGALTSNPMLMTAGAGQMMGGSPAGQAFGAAQQANSMNNKINAPSAPGAGMQNSNSSAYQVPQSQFQFQTDPTLNQPMALNGQVAPEDQLTAMNRRMQAYGSGNYTA